MKIGIVSFAVGREFKKIVRSGIESKKKYCKIQNYDLLDNVLSVMDKKRAPNWAKLPLILKHMSNYDWLVWIDADTIIMNPTIRLEKFLKEAKVTKKHHLLLTRDPRGSINTGMFFVRNSPWSRSFLKKVYQQHIPPNAPWTDQLAFIKLFRKNALQVRNKTQFEHKTWKFNAYPQEKNHMQKRNIPTVALYHKGDFLVHFAGLHKKEMAQAFRAFLQTNHPPRTSKNMKDMFMHRGKKRTPKYVPEEILKLIET